MHHPVQSQQASDNMKAYCATAALPQMLRTRRGAARGRRASPIDNLEPSPAEIRTLLQAACLSDAFVDRLARTYPLPYSPLGRPNDDGDLEESLNIPGYGCSGNQTLLGETVRTEADVAEWVDSVVLTTLQRVLHICDTLEMEKWELVRRFEAPDDAPKARLKSFSTMIVRRIQQLVRYDIRPHVNVITFAPWDVTQQDLLEFAQDMCFSAYHRYSGVHGALSQSEKLWMHVFDKCLNLQTRWFVVNTGDFWCFGFFGNGWRTGFVTQPRPGGCSSPSIMEYLVLWAKSSMETENDHFGIRIQRLELSTAEIDSSVAGDDMDDASDAQTEIDGDEPVYHGGYPTPPGSDYADSPAKPSCKPTIYPLSNNSPLGRHLRFHQDSHLERAERLGLTLPGTDFPLSYQDWPKYWPLSQPASHALTPSSRQQQPTSCAVYSTSLGDPTRPTEESEGGINLPAPAEFLKHLSPDTAWMITLHSTPNVANESFGDPIATIPISSSAGHNLQRTDSSNSAGPFTIHMPGAFPLEGR